MKNQPFRNFLLLRSSVTFIYELIRNSHIMSVRSWASIMRLGVVVSKFVTVVKYKLYQLFVFISQKETNKMSHQALVEYITSLYLLYKNSDKTRKSQLLGDATSITNRTKRTLLRHFRKIACSVAMPPVIKGRGRKPRYNHQALKPHLKYLWQQMEYISPVRMKAALPLWISYYQSEDLTEELREQILSLSRGTLARMLKQIRSEVIPKRGLATTSAASKALRMQVPINPLDYKIVRPGFLQADTVAHCGNSAAGNFVSSLTVTDIYSGWTENRAMFTKRALEVRRELVSIKRSLPFKMITLNTDSGSEFINKKIINLMGAANFNSEGPPVLLTRSRPYQKNDNCYVEQRNYTHVRQLFGYERFERRALVEQMNKIYSEFWNPLHNYFLPSQKLLQKTRLAARIIKKHDKPQTPAQRLIASTYVSEATKLQLRETLNKLNPFILVKSLETELATFYTLQRELNLEQENINNLERAA
jgi:hypothetical protein